MEYYTLDQLIEKVQDIHDDPMWPQHAEISKNLLSQILEKLCRLQALEEMKNES